MALITFAAGETLTAAKLNSAFDLSRIKYQTADQSVTSSTTLVDSTSLTLSVEANAGYLYEALLIYDANSTADFKHNVDIPAGAAIRHATWTPTNTVSATNTTVAIDALDVATFNSGGVAAGTMMTLRPTGVILTSSTAGDVTIQFAQAVSNATATTLKIGSWMRLTKVL